MNSETVGTLFEVGGMIVKHIRNAIERGDEEELKKLREVWPAPIQSRITLLSIEEKARQKIKRDSGIFDLNKDR